MTEHNPDLPPPIDVIPHRAPHLWLDGVTLTIPGQYGNGFWTPGPEHFNGHFDAVQLLMGVKQVETITQLGSYVMMYGSDEPSLGIFKGIEQASFVSPVRPGDCLDIEIHIIDRDKRDFKGSGTTRVAGRTTCEATIIGTMIPERVANMLFERQRINSNGETHR